MIDFTSQTYANILQAMLDRVSDSYDKRDTSPIQTALGPAAYALEEFYLELAKVQQSAFIQTAVGDDLDQLAIMGGISRNAASSAVRLGTFNVQVPIGARFSTINGADSINFVVTSYAGQVGSSYTYDLTAETAGSIGNEYIGAILPITSIVGLTSATISTILVAGEDEENDEDLRARLIEALLSDAFAGNVQAYREHVLAIAGVGGVQVYPAGRGAGTVVLSVVDGDYDPASAYLVSEIQTDVDPTVNQGQGLGYAPIGATVTVMAPTAVGIDINATVTLAPGKEFGQVEQPIIDALDAYLLSIRKSWDTNVSSSAVQYSADVYLSQITSAIVSVPGVQNVTGVTIGRSGSSAAASDISLTESGTLQEIPIMGTVNVHE